MITNDVYSNYSCLYCFADQTIPALLGIITNPIFMIITSIFDVQVFWWKGKIEPWQQHFWGFPLLQSSKLKCALVDQVILWATTPYILHEKEELIYPRNSLVIAFLL